MEPHAVAILEKENNVLFSLTQESGYDSCHKIEDNDASICAKDCDMLKKSEFAEKCQQKKGLFKCCIRSNNSFFVAVIRTLSSVLPLYFKAPVFSAVLKPKMIASCRLLLEESWFACEARGETPVAKTGSGEFNPSF